MSISIHAFLLLFLSPTISIFHRDIHLYSYNEFHCHDDCISHSIEITSTHFIALLIEVLAVENIDAFLSLMFCI